MPGSGKHNVGNIDSFFKVRPSRLNVREGEVISFLEDGNLVKQEKRNGVIYQSVFVEQGKKKKKQQLKIKHPQQQYLVQLAVFLLAQVYQVVELLEL